MRRNRRSVWLWLIHAGVLPRFLHAPSVGLFLAALLLSACFASLASGQAQLAIDHTEIIADDCPLGGGDGNGFPEPGESVTLRIYLVNNGTADATNITGTLSSTTPGVTISQNTATLGRLAPTDPATALAPDYAFDIDLSLICGAVLDFEIHLEYTENPAGEDETFGISLPDPCTKCSPPDLSLDSAVLQTDTCAFGGPGGGNGFADPGETVTLRVTLRNEGGETATNVTGVMSSSTPGVTVTADTGAIASLAPGTSDALAPDYTFTIASNAACGTRLDFTVSVTYDQGTDSFPVSIDIPDPCDVCFGPDLQFAALSVVLDRCALGMGNGNGIIEPGEDVTFNVDLVNNGIFDATGVSAVLSSSTPGVTVTQNASTYPDIPLTEQRTSDTPFGFRTDAALIDCGSTLQFTLTVGYAGGSNTTSFPITIQAPCAECAEPSVAYRDNTLVTDVCRYGLGDGNRRIEPGEAVNLTIDLNNSGSADAIAVSAVLSSITPGVTVTQDASTYPNIPAGLFRTSRSNYSFTIDPTVVDCGNDLNFTLSITYTGGSDTSSFAITIPASPCTECVGPYLGFDALNLVNDACAINPANNNGRIEPGEAITVTIALVNTGNAAATGLVGTLSSTTAGVAITTAASPFPVIGIGETKTSTGTFAFTLDPVLLDCGAMLNFTLDLTYTGGSDVVKFSFPVASPCTECSRPVLGYAANTLVNDDCVQGGVGDANGRIEPGEAVTLTVSLTNSGNKAATGVNAALSTTTPGVGISQSSASYPDIGPGETKAGTNFIFSTNSTIIACGDTIRFNLNITFTGGSNTGTFTVTIPSANCTPCAGIVADLEFDQYALQSDTCSLFPPNNDGTIEPGEDVLVSIRLLNNGPDNATGISALLSPTTPGVTVTQTTSAFPDIAAGSSGTGLTDFELTTDPTTVTCGITLRFTLNITYAGGGTTDTFSIPIPIPGCVSCLDLDTTVTPLFADQCPNGGAGDADGRIEPGETVELWFTVRNDSSVLYHTVQGTITSPTPGITIAKDTAAFGDILMMSIVDNGSDRFVFDVDASALGCGSNFDIALLLAAPEGVELKPATFTIPTPCVKCQAVGCAIGTPDKIRDLKLVRVATDFEMHWTRDLKAQGGWDIYMTNDKTTVNNLRRPALPPDFHSDVEPYAYVTGVTAGLKFYEVLGVCIDGTSQGPN